MSNMSANMIKPLFSALPEDQRRAFAEWMREQEKDQAQPEPVKKNSEEEALHTIADQLGDFYRPGKEEEAISEIMFS